MYVECVHHTHMYMYVHVCRYTSCNVVVSNYSSHSLQMQQAQQARANIHSGGGSMPSLAAIDTNPPPSIDMQV